MYGIGIDVGYEFCGLACMELSTRKVVNYMQIETARTKQLVDRLKLVHDVLSEQLSSDQIKAVAYENPLRTAAAKAKRHQTSKSSLILHIVVGHIQSLCWERGIQLEMFEPQQVKIAVMGKGHGDADKPQIQHMVRVLTGFNMTEHEADAAACAFALARHLSKQDMLSRVNA